MVLESWNEEAEASKEASRAFIISGSENRFKNAVSHTINDAD